MPKTIYDGLQDIDFGVDEATAYTESLTNLTQQKTSNLQQKKQQKLNITTDNIQHGTLYGIEDADGSYTINGESGYRLSATGDRYDAVEVKHGNHPYDMYGISKEDQQAGMFGKSRYSMQKQREQVANLVGKPVNQVTEQDMVDVGNMQQIQALSDIANADDIAAGKERWRAPLIQEVEQTNLTGRYKDEKGDNVSIPLDVPINYANTNAEGLHGRSLINIVDSKGKVSLTDIAASDPVLNAFARSSSSNSTLDPATQKWLASAKGPDEILRESGDKGGWYTDLISGAVKGFTSGEMETANLVEDLGRAVAGVEGEGLLTNKDIDKASTAVAKKFGYDVDAVKVDMLKQEELTKEAFKGTYDPTEWDYGKVLDLIGQSFSSFSMTGNSVGVMLAAVAGGGGVKLVAKGLSKAILKKTTQEAVKKSTKSRAIVEAAKAKLKDKSISSADKFALKKEVVKNRKNLLAKEATFKYAKEIATPLAYGMATAEQDIAELRKRGEEITPARIATAVITDTLAIAVPELAVAKFQLGFLVDSAGKALKGDTLKKRAIEAFKGAVTAYGASVGFEVPQEMLQQGVQALNQKWGTKAYEGKSPLEIVKEEANNVLGAGVMAVGMSSHMMAPGVAVKTAKIPFGVKLNNELESKDKEQSNIAEEAIKANPDEQAQDLALDKLYTHLHENGEPLPEEDKPLAHASVERHLNNTLQSLALAEENINAEIAKENPDTEFIGSLEKEKENLEDKISILLDMRNHTAEDGVIYNNRPLKEIDNDLIQTIKQLNVEPEDPKLIKKKRQLLLEKYVASHPLAKKANENGEDTVDTKATFDTVLSQKLYGGSTKDGYRTGIMNMVSPLLDDSIGEVEKRAVTNNIERFLKSQSAKEKAIEAAKTKFEEQGKDAEENPTPVIAKYFTPTGTEATFEYRGIVSEKTLEKIKRENEFLHSILYYASNPVELESVVSNIGSKQSNKVASDDFFEASKNQPKSDYALESEEGINTNFENKKTPILNNTEDTPKAQSTIEGKITELNDLLGNKQHESFSKKLEETIESIPSFSTDTLNQLKEVKGLKGYITRVRNGINFIPKLLARLTKEPNEQGTPIWNARAYRAIAALEKYAKAANKIIENEAYQKIQQNVSQKKSPNTEQPVSNTSTSMNEAPSDISNTNTGIEPKENNSVNVQNNIVETGSNKIVNIESNDNKFPNTKIKQPEEVPVEAISEKEKQSQSEQNKKEVTETKEESADKKVESKSKSDKEVSNKEKSSKTRTLDNHGPIERKNKSDIFYKDDTTYKDPTKQKEKELVNSVVGRLQVILNNYEKQYKKVETVSGIDIKTIKAERAKLTKTLKEFTGIKDIASRGKVKRRYFYEDLSVTIEDLLEDIDENSYFGKHIIEEINKIRPNSKIGIEILENNSISKTIEESLLNLINNKIISKDVVNSLKEIAGC